MIFVTGDIHGTLETDKVVNFFKEQAIKQFLSKEDLFELIPSKDMRKYLDEQGRKFSDFEKATLIYNSRGFKKIEKEHALKELAQSTQDDKLINQIIENFEENKRLFETFINNRDGYIYHLTGERDDLWMSDRMDTELGYYTSHEIAKKRGLEYRGPFSVTKVRVLSEADNPRSLKSGNYLAWDAGAALGEICYDSDGNISSIWCNELDENTVKVLTAENRKRFEHAYIDIPYPFRTGDIVCIVDSESSDRFGVVTHIRTEMEYQACRDKLNRLNLDGHVDFSDCAVTVNVIEKNGSFSKVHINPLRLEFTEVSENNPLKSVLECARDLLIGSGDLEGFQRSCKELLESV